MKVHGLLSFFQEPIPMLQDCIRALGKFGVDNIVACDGRYQMFPADHDVSPSEQHEAIKATAAAVGMGCTLHVPERAWEGNEVEKRTALFALAWSLAEDGDWYWVQDADQITVHAPSDWKRQLAKSRHDVASVEMIDVQAREVKHDSWPDTFEMRSLFRAQPITVETNHCTYVTADGRVLWGQITAKGTREKFGQIECLDMRSIKVEHRSHQRPADRLAAKMTYYAERDASGIERGRCECGVPSVRLVARNWRWAPSVGRAVADWHEACAKHARRWEYEGEWELRRLGANPAEIQRAVLDGRGLAVNKNGHVPVPAQRPA